MTDDDRDQPMITTTTDGDSILSVRLDWEKITGIACAVALGIIIAVIWLELAGVTRGQ